MFSPLFGCLSVCEQDIAKSYGRIWTKLCGQVGCVTRMNLVDSSEDPDPDLDPDRRVFLKWFFIIERYRQKIIFQKVVDGLVW